MDYFYKNADGKVLRLEIIYRKVCKEDHFTVRVWDYISVSHNYVVGIDSFFEHVGGVLSVFEALGYESKKPFNPAEFKDMLRQAKSWEWLRGRKKTDDCPVKEVKE